MRGPTIIVANKNPKDEVIRMKTSRHLRRWAVLGLALVVMVALTGCVISPKSFKADAFGKKKRFAVVTIVSSPKISGNSGNSSITGMVKAVGKKSGYSADANKIFKASVPIVMRELKKSRHFTLVPESKIIRSKRYKALEGDPPKILWAKMLVAKGYKYFGKAKFKNMAKELRVDGAINVSLNYGYGFSGVNIAGAVSAGYHKAQVLLTINAVDRDGNIVWRETVNITSDKKLPAIGESVNFTKLRPLLMQATRKAAKELVKRLDKNMA